MEWSRILTVLFLAALVGFGAYCLTCAVHVWRTRNLSTQPACPTPRAAVPWMRRLSLAACIAGALLAVVMLLASVFAPRRGVLHAKGALSVRCPEGLQATWATGDEVVAKNAPLVRFTDPEHEGEMRALHSKLKQLQSARAALAGQPLEFDGEITRRLLEASSQHRSLRTNLVDQQIERRRLERQLLQDRLGWQDQIHRLSSELSALREQHAQALAEWNFNWQQLRRVDSMQRVYAVSERELEQWAVDTAVADERTKRLAERIQAVQLQKAQLQQGLADLVGVLGDQRSLLDQEITSNEQRLATADAQIEGLEQRLQKDAPRAAGVRGQELAETEAQLQAAQARLHALTGALVQSAPFAGHIVYRAASPRAARKDDPLLVLAPENGLRFRLRIPAWQRIALQRAGTIDLELLSPAGAEGQLSREFVERRFAGRFAAWKTLPDDPGYGVAELV